MFEVAVRTLCEFAAKRGDLDIRFTPSPSAAEGIAAHRTIAARRGASFQTEISLAGDSGDLRVRGRADGYDPQSNRLEEFKSYRGELERMPGNHRDLHWAQLRIYGWLLCSRKALDGLRLALVYFDVATGRETVLEENQPACALEEHFHGLCRQYRGWAAAQAAHRVARDKALRALEFPFAAFHDGQRRLARAVFERLLAGGSLLAQAPTGIGKTLGTLFPGLRAMSAGSLDKLFYLVAKTSGRALALRALRNLRGAKSDFPLRVVELVARAKACECPGLPCEPAACPLARGFYDRLPAAREEALSMAFLDQDGIRQVALRHRICPYYLGQELARWSDVVVGDYNYYFDRSAMLFGWTVMHEWRIGVLVDEAHNLLERGRAMYTAALDRGLLVSLRNRVPAALAGPLAELERIWLAIEREQTASHRICAEVPAALLAALDRSVAAALDHFGREPQALPGLQEFFFAALSFTRLSAEFDSNTLFEITSAPGSPSRLCLRNLVPARFLAPRFAAAHSTVLFSATLSPHSFYRDVLGVGEGCEFLEVDSPFRSEQLAVRLVRSISTRLCDRPRSLRPLADLLARQFDAVPGNYLAFLSSFEYLDQLAASMRLRHGHIPLWRQHAGMAEADREAFLAEFRPGGQGIGFAVLGGAFAEGVDLPGSRLIGAFVVTLGLPRVDAVNREMQQRMQALFGAGYEYTYLYPGLQKVVQAAGRVIRGPDDRGILYLIDDRYGRPEVLDLLPRWWDLRAGAPAAASSGGGRRILSPRPS
jgi:Rad3-related DNA helicase